MTTTIPPRDRTIYMPLIRTGPAQPPQPPDSHWALLAAILLTKPPQERPLMLWHETVATVAQEHCEDMARRNFFGHTNPDGIGANDRLRAAGLVLPAYYGDNPGANKVESLAAGQQTPAEVWEVWMSSSDHRPHVLGQTDFYREQQYYGIGFARGIPGFSTYSPYWAVVTVKLEES